ncbi:MAG TPA: CHAT domain-containing protein [Pyrinomonadaceae bacterium]|nr:CHAT domain-containing protein [Pyrinomonadaceae bacterium]
MPPLKSPAPSAPRAALLLLSLALLPAFAFTTARAQAPFEPQAIERDITGGMVHTFRLNLKPGQFVRAVYDQRGADVVLALVGPDGRRLLKIDSPVGEWGPEPIFFEIEEAGYYTIEVRSRREWAPPGRYEFRLTARRPTPQDLRRFPAERVFAAATALLTDGDAPAYVKAIGQYELALEHFKSLGDYRGQVTTLGTLASVSLALGRGRQALDYYTDALALLRTSNDSREEARALSGVARVHFALGDRDRALAHFRQALALFRASGDSRGAAYTLNQVGHAHGTRGEERQALEAYEQALKLFRSVGDRRGEAVALNNIGLSYDALGRREQARASFKGSHDVFEATGNCREIGPSLSNLAGSALEEGDTKKALEYLNHALGVQRGAVDREGEATTLNNIGFVHHSLGDHPRALSHFNQSLAIQRATANRKGEGDTLSNLMLSMRAQAKPGPAVFYGKQAVSAYQEVRASLPPLDREAQKSFLKTREFTYRRLAELLIEQGRLPEAQQVIGFLKDEEYYQFVRRDSGGSATAPAALTPAEAAADRQYKEMSEHVATRGRVRAELLQKTARTPEDEKQLSLLDAELAAASQAFQTFLDKLSAELGDTRQGARVEDVRESQALADGLREVGAGSVAVYTIVGEEKYSVILITPDVQVAREYTIKAAELNRKVAAFREVLQNPSADPRPAAQDLYRVVVGPIAKDLEQAKAETIMWSLDGVLRYAPVAALHDGRQYMVEKYRNSVFTKASLSHIKDEPSARWRALGFGVSKSYGDFAALPAVPEELRGIIKDEAVTLSASGVLPGKISLDEAFTADAFKTALRQRFPLVHVASHFQFQPGNETDSFLLLGDGSRLSLAQIKTAFNLFSGVELLTLSACDTATGGAGADGKEVEGFGVLAQRQGAKAVVASLWPVADASTRRLMQEFYRLRDEQSGLPKSEALRQAQLSLLRGAPEASGDAARRGLSADATAPAGGKSSFAHPYFWAPFILIGNWR